MRWAILLCAVLGAACQTNDALEGQFRCERNVACPADYQCVAGLCVGAVAGVTPCASVDLWSSSFDEPKWLEVMDVDLPSTGGGAVNIDSGDLVLTTGTNDNSTTRVSADAAFDLTLTPLVLEVAKVGGEFTEVALADYNNERVYFGVTNGDLFVHANNRDLTRRPYSAQQDRWWRVRSQDNLMIFETSPDGEAWTLFAQDLARLQLQWTDIALQIGSAGSVDTARFSTLNPNPSALARWCAVSTWRDDFQDGRTEIESDTDNNSCNIAETNGLLTFTTSAGESYCWQAIRRPIDLRDSTVTMQVTPAAAPAYTSISFISPRGKHRIAIEAQSDLDVDVRSNDVNLYSGNGPLPSTGMQYWRLSLAGPQLRFETSLDGVTWELRTSTMVPTLDASAMVIEREVYVGNTNTMVRTAQFGELR